MTVEDREGGESKKGKSECCTPNRDVPNVEEGHKYTTQSSVLLYIIQHVSEF